MLEFAIGYLFGYITLLVVYYIREEVKYGNEKKTSSKSEIIRKNKR